MLYYRYIFILFLPILFLASCAKNEAIVASDIDLSPDSYTVENVEHIDNDIDIEVVEKLEELQEIDNAGAWHLENKPEPSSEQIKSGKEYFPLVITPQVEAYLQKFQGRQKKQMTRWFNRSGKYIDMMTEELVKKGLPTELVYLSMIESAYIQEARSSASAVGLWQFMKGTGKGYGLQINRYIDERKNALKSTKAAATYLSELYDRFKDWHLAVAAYNAGPGNVNYGLTKYKVDNFWDLAETKHLRLETKSYVPKLIATILVAKDPLKYGFDEFELEPPADFDTLRVGGGLPLDAIAKISGTNTKNIKKLNPELRQSRTPVNVKNYDVKIPKGSYGVAKSNLPRLHSFVSTGYKIHIYRKGERISSICRKYNINQTTLFKVNNIMGSTISENARLKIPYSTVVYKLIPKGSGDGDFVADENNLILHKIKRGESVNSIARKYSIPSSLIVSWNSLKNAAKIREGQQLALYINKKGDKTNGVKKHVLLAAENKKRASDNHEMSKPTATQTMLVAEKTKIVNNNTSQVTNIPQKIVLNAETKKILVGKKADSVEWYLVRNGDSIWTISRKFKISPNSIKRENNLDSNLIHPGSKLKIVKG